MPKDHRIKQRKWREYLDQAGEDKMFQHIMVTTVPIINGILRKVSNLEELEMQKKKKNIQLTILLKSV